MRTVRKLTVDELARAGVTNVVISGEKALVVVPGERSITVNLGAAATHLLDFLVAPEGRGIKND